MSKAQSSYPVYRALLRLYPKAHRQEYGEQMLQTLDDMLSEHQNKSERMAIWLRIGRELPLNVVEEHINNWEGIQMSKLLNRRTGIVAGVVTIIAVGVGISLGPSHNTPYSPTTFAHLQSTSSKPVCLQKPGTNSAVVDSQNKGYIENTIATSIIDALAGTNVDAYFRTYDGKTATGTTAYSGKYGNYNFTVEQSTGDTGDTHYFGHWKVTRFQPCRT